MSGEENLKILVHQLSQELFSPCHFCTLFISDPNCKNPIYCSKFTGPSRPTPLDAKTCLACGEYKETT